MELHQYTVIMTIPMLGEYKYPKSCIVFVTTPETEDVKIVQAAHNEVEGVEAYEDYAEFAVKTAVILEGHHDIYGGWEKLILNNTNPGDLK